MSIKNVLSHLIECLHMPDAIFPYHKKIRDLKDRIEELEEEIKILKKVQKTGDIYNHYIVREMTVEKFEMNLESIDVDQVKGALNVGIIHNSVVNREKGRSSPHYSKIYGIRRDRKT